MDFLAFSPTWAGFFSWIFFFINGLEGWLEFLLWGSLGLLLFLFLFLVFPSLSGGVSTDDIAEKSTGADLLDCRVNPDESGVVYE